MGPLSVDLRKRVVSAVGEEGMSCRAAARRFGVSFASAIRWVAALRERGHGSGCVGGAGDGDDVEREARFLHVWGALVVYREVGAAVRPRCIAGRHRCCGWGDVDGQREG